MKIDFRPPSPVWCRYSCPNFCSGSGADGMPLFKEFAAAIVPTEFLPGKLFGNGSLHPIDYCVAMAEGRIEPPSISISQRSSNKNWQIHFDSIFLNICCGGPKTGRRRDS